MGIQGQSHQTIELSEARVAYQTALIRLAEALPQVEAEPVVVDPSQFSWGGLLLRAALLFPRALWRGLRRLWREFGEEAGETLGDLKGRLARFIQGQPSVLGGPAIAYRDQIRALLLEVLWARDHVQESIESRDGASYESKRSVLAFVMVNETRLQQLGQQALEITDLSTADLREAQPTPPKPEHWWWFLNYPRARRTRRLNTLWFILALVPALASIILVTLLAQRLAINGPDLLSGASVVAQVGLGLGSIIAGREILTDLLLRGTTSSWQGQLTFALASLFLVVVVVFYFFAPPGAAMIYNLFGRQAIKAGNAAEAELYLESAARLDPDPHAASLLEVGCLYETLGAPDRAQSVFERVLEADSRLLLARYHLAELYSDKGEYGKALQLVEDGLNLLDTAEEQMLAGDSDFLPNIDTLEKVDHIAYLLQMARGRAYLESDAPEQAKSNLRDAEDLFNAIAGREAPDGNIARLAIDQGRAEPSCGPDDDLVAFILSTQMNLHYHLARTYDGLCDDEATVEAALEEWRLIRNGRPSSSRQEAWRDDATRRLSSGETCATGYGLADTLGVTGLPTRR
jgi:tetratricopeptide (TPR) repeat protein